MDAMKLFVIAVLACFAFEASSANSPKVNRTAKPAILQRENYDLAETIFVQFLADSAPEGTNSVRLLSYGPADSDLPADFLARFRAHVGFITNASAGEIRQIWRSGHTNSVLVDKQGSRECLAIGLRTLNHTKDGAAEATVVKVSSGITIITWTVRLKRDGAKWKLIEKKQRSISCFGL
jgi:hypothetical protein